MTGILCQPMRFDKVSLLLHSSRFGGPRWIWTIWPIYVLLWRVFIWHWIQLLYMQCRWSIPFFKWTLMNLMSRRSNVAVLVICTLVAVCAETNTAARGTLTIQTVDSATKKPIPARIHIKDHEGKPVQVPRITFWKDHHTFDGQIRLSLRDGIYTFEIEHGPE